MADENEVMITPKKFITITLLFGAFLVAFALLGSNAIAKHSKY